MSTESSLDSHLIEQTKRQIRSLVEEIRQLAKSDCSPEQFYSQFLDRLVSALAANGGAVWVVDDDGRLNLQYQINLQDARLHENEEGQKQHARLLYQTLESGEAVLVPPRSGSASEEEAANPTDFLLVLGVLKTELQTAGLVEIFQRSEAGPSTQRGYLSFLVQMCELAAEFLKSHQLKHFSHRQVLWAQLEDFCRVVHGGLHPRATAYTIANEGRRLIECDRLSVALARGRRCVIEAISGQDVFDRRANNVRLLEKLATAVTATGDPMWYTGDTRDLAPEVENAVQEYVDESHSKTVAVLPLRPPQDETADDKKPAPPPLGALIIEQIEDSRVPEALVQRSDVVSRHSTLALANALEHHNLFLMPVWRAIGHSRIVMEARYLPWTISVSIALVAVAILLTLWQAPFRLEAKGTLEPVQRRDVYATGKGVVENLYVEHGQSVKKGEPLVELRDNELEVALADVRGQRQTALETVSSLERVKYEAHLTDEKLISLEGQRAEQVQRAMSLDAQLKLLEHKKAELSVLSPMDGRVVTWDLEHRLLRRPVERGQALMEVADLSGPWELELHMPEHRMGHVASELQKRQEAAARDPAKAAAKDVFFQLATDPGHTFEGKVTDVQLVAQVRGEEGNTVLIRVQVNKDELPHLRQGTAITAKVDCGYAPLGYVWLHDLWAFFQSKIIFKYF